jgi:PAS domain S-box-containing protein
MPMEIKRIPRTKKPEKKKVKQQSARSADVVKNLNESAQLFRTLTERSLAGIYVVQNGKFKMLNPNAASYAGYKSEELIGKKSDFLVHPEDRESVRRNAREMLRRNDKKPHEFRIITKQGKVRWIMETVTSISFKGKPALLGNSMNITEYKRAEEALQESERRMADIIDFLPDATVAIDLDGKVIAWNRAIEEMTGVPAEDMLGQGDYEYALPFYGKRRPIMIDLVLNPDKDLEERYSYILKRQKDLLVVETWVPRLKGEPAFLWGKATPLYNSKGQIVGAIESIRDITERKRTEEALKKREEDLKSKTRELEDLNAALRVLLKQREEDRNELEKKIMSNVKALILPNIEKVRNHIDLKGVSYVNVLEANLREIVSPFAMKLMNRYLEFTNREVQVADLIREGKTTKEIAELLNVSDSAVNVYRYQIRKKLSLSKKQNLRSYLSSFE